MDGWMSRARAVSSGIVDRAREYKAKQDGLPNKLGEERAREGEWDPWLIFSFLSSCRRIDVLR